MKTVQPIPDFTPGPVSAQANRIWFEMNGQSHIEKNRAYVLNVLLSIALIIALSGYAVLLPLKTVEAVKVTQTTGGRLVSDGEIIGKFTPDQENISYFLNQWANKVFDINAATIDATTEDSMALTTGTATQQLAELRRHDNPYVRLRQFPGLTREYRFLSINHIENQVALLRFETVIRANGQTETTPFVMRITYTLIKPKTIQEVIKNPAGIFVTSFNLTKEATR